MTGWAIAWCVTVVGITIAIFVGTITLGGGK